MDRAERVLQLLPANMATTIFIIFDFLWNTNNHGNLNFPCVLIFVLSLRLTLGAKLSTPC